MRNNFEQISTLLDFSEPNTFYFVQILKRRKENPEMQTGVRVINNYYIYSHEDLTKLRDKIMEDCTKHNARAYINPNRLDSEKIAMYSMKISLDYILQKDYKAVRNAYATACGSHHSESAKRWIVDIDQEFLEKKNVIRHLVETLLARTGKKEYSILAEIPTKSGVHLISNPFNLSEFRKGIEDLAPYENDPLRKIDVQKNSPTVLYIP